MGTHCLHLVWGTTFRCERQSAHEIIWAMSSLHTGIGGDLLAVWFVKCCLLHSEFEKHQSQETAVYSVVKCKQFRCSTVHSWCYIVKCRWNVVAVQCNATAVVYILSVVRVSVSMLLSLSHLVVCNAISWSLEDIIMNK